MPYESKAHIDIDFLNGFISRTRKYAAFTASPLLKSNIAVKDAIKTIGSKGQALLPKASTLQKVAILGFLARVGLGAGRTALKFPGAALNIGFGAKDTVGNFTKSPKGIDPDEPVKPFSS